MKFNNRFLIIQVVIKRFPAGKNMIFPVYLCDIKKKYCNLRPFSMKTEREIIKNQYQSCINNLESIV